MGPTDAALGGQCYGMVQRDRATGYPLVEGLVSKEPKETVDMIVEFWIQPANGPPESWLFDSDPVTLGRRLCNGCERLRSF